MEIGMATIGLKAMVIRGLVRKLVQTLQPEITHSSTNGVQLEGTFKAAQTLHCVHLITKHHPLIGQSRHSNISLKCHSS